MPKQPLWTSTFVINMLLNFIYYLVYFLLTVIIGLVAMEQMHAPASLAGILSGIFIVGGFVGRVWTGNVIAKLGQKRLLYIGAGLFLLMTIPYYFIHSVGLLLVVRFLHGIGFGIAATTSGTIAGHIIPRRRRGEGIGYYALSVTLASAFGPFLSIAIYDMSSYTMLLNMSVALLALSFLATFFIRVREIKYVQESKPEESGSLLSRIFEKSALPISLIAFLSGITYSSVLSFLASYTTQIHLVSAGSLFYIIYALFILLSRPLSGRLFDSKGDNFVLYPLFVCFAIGLALVGLANSAIMLFIAAAFFGLGYGSFSPFGQAIAIRHSSAQRMGTATSTFFGLLDMGVGFGPFVLGAVLPYFGYRKLYFLAAGATLLILVLYWGIHGRKQKVND
jgi:MFS family permease